MSPEAGRLDSAPDLIQRVLGFRQWRVRRGVLHSMFYDDERWPSATVTARCRTGGHAGPAHGCTCGIHAWYRPCPRTASTADSELVAGAVVLWGEVELHVTGMRAQYCRVVALALPISRRRKRDAVLEAAQRLGVPAVPHRALATVAAEHGAPVPEALRPPRDCLRQPGQVFGLVPRIVHSAGTSHRNSRGTPDWRTR